ncbi:MAG: hypothetical protein C4293_11825 [Nitrospiraceae bacterium]
MRKGLRRSEALTEDREEIEDAGGSACERETVCRSANRAMMKAEREGPFLGMDDALCRVGPE